MGGAGTHFAATYANVRRVKVTNRDGSQQVVELSDEGGLPLSSPPLSLSILPILTLPFDRWSMEKSYDNLSKQY